MGDYKELVREAYREAKLADHMLYVTSKVVNDKKIVISVVDHLTKAFILSMKAFLDYERLYRRVSAVPEDTNMMIKLFFDECSKELKIEDSLMSIIFKLSNAMNAYNKRGMLLTRTERFVFVSQNYELIDLRMSEVKNWLKQSLRFVNVIKERLLI